MGSLAEAGLLHIAADGSSGHGGIATNLRPAKCELGQIDLVHLLLEQTKPTIACIQASVQTAEQPEIDRHPETQGIDVLIPPVPMKPNYR